MGQVVDFLNSIFESKRRMALSVLFSLLVAADIWLIVKEVMLIISFGAGGEPLELLVAIGAFILMLILNYMLVIAFWIIWQDIWNR